MYLFIFNFLFLMLVFVIFILFMKVEKWEEMSKSVFECGFSSYFFSRFTFSIHYYILGLTFLLMDLELCFLMPFFNEESNSLKIYIYYFFFSFLLTLALILEWMKGFIYWKI